MTYICKPYVFRIVLFLTLLNPLGLLKSRRKMYTNFFSYISKKYINFYPKFWGLSLVGGPRRWPRWPRPKASTETCKENLDIQKDMAMLSKKIPISHNRSHDIIIVTLITRSLNPTSIENSITLQQAKSSASSLLVTSNPFADNKLVMAMRRGGAKGWGLHPYPAWFCLILFPSRLSWQRKFSCPLGPTNPHPTM